MPAAMTALSVSLMLGSLLTLSRAHPPNSTVLMRGHGLCEYERNQSPPPPIGAFVPQCDANGNFLPQQCWSSTGFCWCVNTMTGEEIPNTRTPPGSTPVDCGDKHYCPYRWTHFGKRCFIFINNMKTWAKAVSYCLFEGANLASIHSPEENRFIRALTRGDSYVFPLTWIGGFDAIYLNYWMWTDGSNFDYENWSSDYKPNKTSRCLQMNYGHDKTWINAPCIESRPFVCAKMM